MHTLEASKGDRGAALHAAEQDLDDTCPQLPGILVIDSLLVTVLRNAPTDCAVASFSSGSTRHEVFGFILGIATSNFPVSIFLKGRGRYLGMLPLNSPCPPEPLLQKENVKNDKDLKIVQDQDTFLLVSLNLEHYTSQRNTIIVVKDSQEEIVPTGKCIRKGFYTVIFLIKIKTFDVEFETNCTITQNSLVEPQGRGRCRRYSIEIISK